jgi:hypothetical protein
MLRLVFIMLGLWSSSTIATGQMMTLQQLLTLWPPTHIAPPTSSLGSNGNNNAINSIQRFDYALMEDRLAAERAHHRNEPFIVYNIDSLTETSLKWKNERYLSSVLGSELLAVDESTSQFFTWFNPKLIPQVHTLPFIPPPDPLLFSLSVVSNRTIATGVLLVVPPT